jgi:hypothetical protein
MRNSCGAVLFHPALPCVTIMLRHVLPERRNRLEEGSMERFVVALVLGLIATALQVGVVSAADPPVAIAAPATADAGAAAPSPAANADSSRYQFYNGYWWYWTKDNRWVCYMNGQWVSPSPAAQAGPPVQAAPPMQASVPVYQYQYNVVPQPYYGPYPYGYDYPYPYYGGGLYIGGGFGGYGHGGYGYGGYGHGGYGGHR